MPGGQTSWPIGTLLLNPGMPVCFSKLKRTVDKDTVRPIVSA
jgi:hypothetical protein